MKYELRKVSKQLAEALKALDDLIEEHGGSVDGDELVFNMFRKKYPGTKNGNKTEFDFFKKKHKDWREILPILESKLQAQIETRDKKKLRNEFVPEWKNLKTWINNRCWEEEMVGGDIETVKIEEFPCPEGVDSFAWTQMNYMQKINFIDVLIKNSLYK